MVEQSSSPTSKYIPLFTNEDGKTTSTIVPHLKRVHPFQWMCVCLGFFVVSPYIFTKSPSLSITPSMTSLSADVGAGKRVQEPMTLTEFIKTNERLLDIKVVENCECGCLESHFESCPRKYNLADVEKSANVLITRDIANHMDFALQERRHASQISCLEREYEGKQHHTDSGGYCLNAFLQLTQEQGQDRGSVVLPFPDRIIPVPKGHAEASPSLLKMLHSFVEKEHITSLSDFGAGLGQYGMDLERKYPKSLLYRGYDGAGDVEVYTQGFLRFFDLTIPLNLPVSDWVMSLEVGEHIPSHLEGMVIRNLHAHNCRGILLSWGTPGQGGLNHINLHDNQYLIDIFTQLGYVHDVKESNDFRNGFTDANWFVTSFMVFRRVTPVC